MSKAGDITTAVILFYFLYFNEEKKSCSRGFDVRQNLETSRFNANQRGGRMEKKTGEEKT
jgi:hypothetical protein